MTTHAAGELWETRSEIHIASGNVIPMKDCLEMFATAQDSSSVGESLLRTSRFMFLHVGGSGLSLRETFPQGTDFCFGQCQHRELIITGEV